MNKTQAIRFIKDTGKRVTLQNTDKCGRPIPHGEVVFSWGWTIPLPNKLEHYLGAMNITGIISGKMPKDGVFVVVREKVEVVDG